MWGQLLAIIQFARFENYLRVNFRNCEDFLPSGKHLILFTVPSITFCRLFYFPQTQMPFEKLICGRIYLLYFISNSCRHIFLASPFSCLHYARLCSIASPANAIPQERYLLKGHLKIPRIRRFFKKDRVEFGAFK